MAALIPIVTAASIVMTPVFVAPPSTAAPANLSATPSYETSPEVFSSARQSAQTSRAASPNVERWRPYIAEASQRFGVPQAWIAAVMQAESAGLTHLHGRPITSRAGAMGLMQVMPATWADMRHRHALGGNPYDPHDNIMAGTAYLKTMHDRFGYPGLFAAYNAGPARYAEHLRTGHRLPGETLAYMTTLANSPASRDMPPAILSGMRLFFTLGSDATTLPDAITATVPRPPESPADDTQSDTKQPPQSPLSGGLFIPRTPLPGGQP